MHNHISKLKLWQEASREPDLCELTKKRFSICLSDFLLDGTVPVRFGSYFNVVRVFNNNKLGVTARVKLLKYIV